jgi:hypothetical protein
MNVFTFPFAFHVTVLKPQICSELEKHRDKALAERKEQRKKTADGEASKKEQAKEKEGKEKVVEADKPPEAAGGGEALGEEDEEANKTIEWQVSNFEVRLKKNLEVWSSLCTMYERMWGHYGFIISLPHSQTLA